MVYSSSVEPSQEVTNEDIVLSSEDEVIVVEESLETEVVGDVNALVASRYAPVELEI